VNKTERQIERDKVAQESSVKLDTVLEKLALIEEAIQNLQRKGKK